MREFENITIFGAGAMGQTLAAWLTHAGRKVSLVARGENARLLEKTRVRILGNDKVVLSGTKVNVIERVDEATNTDLLIITVKNFDLDECCQQLVEHIDPETLVLGLQNGIANQTILPKFFSNVIYAISNYNAWQEPISKDLSGSSLDWRVNVNGPIILGTPDHHLRTVAKRLSKLFSTFISCQYSARFLDDAYIKMVSNLVNSVTTIIGNSHNEYSSRIPLQIIVTEITYEGILVLEAAGIKPTSNGPLPPWWVVKLGRFLPGIITRPIFVRKMAMVGSTSMASDILLKNTGKSELKFINGALLELAQKHSVNTPYNQKLYELCQDRFDNQPFQTLAASDLLRYLSDDVSIN